MDDSHDSFGRGPPRKRSRQQLSCSECKRRKIKCSREIPCEPCIKRNEEEFCHIEPTKPSEPPLSGLEQRGLAQRVQALETVLFATNPSLKRSFHEVLASNSSSPTAYPPSATPPASTISSTAGPSFSALGTHNSNGATVASSTIDDHADHTDTQDAAAVLENLAFHAKAFATSNPLMAASPNLTANSSCPKDLYPTIVKEVPSTSSDAVTQALRRQLIQSLPGPEVIKCLVDIYFDQMAWNARAICRPQFEHDCKEFFQLWAAGKAESVDAAWFALLLAIMALAIPVTMECGKLSKDYMGGATAAAAMFYRQSTYFFSMAEGHEKPQFRCLQSAVLYIIHSGTIDQDDSGYPPHMGWITLAFKQAEMMGLLFLGDDPTHMPPMDSAFPQQPSSLARQLCCRVVWSILFYSYAAIVYQQRPISNDQHITTAAPLNVDDVELGFELHLQKLAELRKLARSFESAKNAVTLALKQLAERKAGHTLDQDETLATTRRLQDALIDFGPQAPLPLRIHCCIGDSAISHTILLINRPWFQRSISDPEQTNKIPSDICVQAAVTCITALQRVTELLNGPTNRFWLLPIHTLSAVVVLSIILLSFPPSSSALDSTAQEYRRLIAVAQDLLQIHETSSKAAVRRAAKCAIRTINILRERSAKFEPLRTGDYARDAAEYLFLVSEDIQSPGREGEPATVTVAEPANTTKGPGWDSSNNFDFTVPPNLAMGEVPFDSGWLGLDEADALNWLNSGYGHL